MIPRYIMMHQVLYIVHLPNEEGDMHITALGAHGYCFGSGLFVQSLYSLSIYLCVILTLAITLLQSIAKHFLCFLH